MSGKAEDMQIDAPKHGGEEESGAAVSGTKKIKTDEDSPSSSIASLEGTPQPLGASSPVGYLNTGMLMSDLSFEREWANMSETDFEQLEKRHKEKAAMAKRMKERAQWLKQQGAQPENRVTLYRDAEFPPGTYNLEHEDYKDADVSTRARLSLVNLTYYYEKTGEAYQQAFSAICDLNAYIARQQQEEQGPSVTVPPAEATQ